MRLRSQFRGRSLHRVALVLLWIASSLHLSVAWAQVSPPRAVAEQDSLALVDLFRTTNGPDWAFNSGWLTSMVAFWHGVTVADGRVVDLSLVSNRLVGQLPQSIGNLTALRTLNLNNNQLSGPIPQSIGNLTNLYFLWLGNNRLSGLVPADIGALAGLQEMDLSVNDLSGPIPSSFVRIPSLYAFYFNDTGICEPLDEEMQAWLRSVEIVGRSGITCEPQIDAPPSCSFSEASPIAATPGMPLSLEVMADDEDSPLLHLSIVELPPGASMSPALPLSGQPPLASTLNWTPSTSGTYWARFYARDDVNTTECSARIEVDDGQAILSASTDALQFGTVDVGASQELDVWLSNIGNAALTISDISIGGDGAAAFSIFYAGDDIVPEDSARMTVRFQPVLAIAHEAVVVITSTGGTVSIQLAGVGAEVDGNVPPACFFSHTSPIAARVGVPVSFEVTGEDEDSDLIQLVAVELPPGATMEPVLPLSGEPPIASTLTWTPSVSGTFLARFSVADETAEAACSAEIAVAANQLVLNELTPSDIPSLKWGESLEYAMLVADTEGRPVSGAIVEVRNSLRGTIEYSPATGADGRTTFGITVPQNLQEGRYGLIFSAAKDGYLNSNSLSRQIDVSRAEPTLGSSTDALDFGTVNISASVDRHLWLYNYGDASLSITDINISGRNADAFSTTFSTGVISPGDSVGALFRFRPTTAGLHEAVAFVSSTGGALSVSLAGVGAGEGFVVAPVRLDFGMVAVGDEAQLEVSASNQTNDAVAITGITVTGTHASDFAATSSTMELAPGEAASVFVLFTPTAGGLRSATVVIESDAGLFEIVLTGQGTTGSTLVLTPATLDFGPVYVGSIATQVLTIQTVGSAAIEVEGYSLSPGLADAFELDGSLPDQIAGGSTIEVIVRFSPVLRSLYSGQLAIETSVGLQMVDIRGEGIQPGIEVQAQTPSVGNSVQIEVILIQNEGFEPNVSELHFRRVGDRPYQTAIFELNGSTGTAVIPSEFVTERGVEYFLRLSDGRATITYPEFDPEENPFWLQVAVDQLQVPYVSAPVAYQMVSVPLLLEPNDAASVFSDYGAYDRTRWRLLRWSSAREAYDEHPDIDAAVEPGLAFWLITNDGAPFNIRNGSTTYQGSTVTRNIVLAPGWNQIGNPFPFPVSWSNIEASGSVGPPVFVEYDRSSARYEEHYGVPILDPWQGYWTHNEEPVPVTLSVSPIATDAGASTSKTLATAAIHSLIPEGAYALQLVAEIPDLQLYDRNTFVGLVDVSGSTGTESRTRKAPPIGDHVRLLIVDEDDRLAASFKHPREGGMFWDLDLVSSLSGSTLSKPRGVRVRIVEHGLRPEGFEIFVLDRDRERPLTLADGTFIVELDRHRPTVSLRLLIGTTSFADRSSDGIPLTPVEFMLQQNYPNPFNPNTTIRFATAERTPVRIQVFNVLGQVVRTLVDSEFSSGVHQVEWDGHNDQGVPVTSGAYLYRMRAGSFTDVKTLLVIR